MKRVLRLAASLVGALGLTALVLAPGKDIDRTMPAADINTLLAEAGALISGCDGTLVDAVRVQSDRARLRHPKGRHPRRRS